MLEGKAMVKETDMPLKMQIQATASASQALDLFDVSDCISIAAHIKKVHHFTFTLIYIYVSCPHFLPPIELCFLMLICLIFFLPLIIYRWRWCLVFFCVQEFDTVYGSGWQCVVGSNFGCYFSHSPGTFIYFALETLHFLIYKGTTSS